MVLNSCTKKWNTRSIYTFKTSRKKQNRTCMDHNSRRKKQSNTV